MAVEIGAQGFVGVAVEVTSGTYQAPTKYFPITSENLMWTQDTRWRRVIRGTADIIGGTAGNGFVEGDINMELLTDVMPYFMKAMRGSVVKTGVGPYVYTFTPDHGALATDTLSFTVVRNGVAFGYVGCQIVAQSYTVDNVTPMATFSVIGTSEADQTLPTATYANDEPFGAGMWEFEVPTTTQVFDTDDFSLDIDDNGTAQMRLKNALGAQFVSFGERSVELSVQRDFENRTDYDAFKAVTAQSVTVRCTHGNGNIAEFVVPASIKDTYEVSLNGVGDLIRASVSYQGTHHDATGGAYQLVVTTAEDVTYV